MTPDRANRHSGTGWKDALRRLSDAPGDLAASLGQAMPKGLYARSLIIIIAPVVILQAIVAYVFMERHWQSVTGRLSAAVAGNVAALVQLEEELPDGPATRALISRLGGGPLGIRVDFEPAAPLPPPLPRPYFSILETVLTEQLGSRLRRPFWIDTVNNRDMVVIRVSLPDTNLLVSARLSQVYASNSHIFIFWMMGASLLLLAVSVLFLRNQIRPILALADAAESFGKGRELADFRPRGAREVRRAALAFIDMRRRVERAMDQRTTMLNGVSHDLRTVLTRFKLSLAVMDDKDPEIMALQHDVDEMARMLDAYLAFARGDAGEQPSPTDIPALLGELKLDAERHGHHTDVVYEGEPLVTVRPDALKRCLSNLVNNAQRFGDDIRITANNDGRYLTVSVDDDGPGVAEDMREEVFRPFLRLDEARNQDHGGTGLGLAIARNIARSHGGDVQLAQSPMGGLRARVRVPV